MALMSGPLLENYLTFTSFIIIMVCTIKTLRVPGRTLECQYSYFWDPTHIIVIPS